MMLAFQSRLAAGIQAAVRSDLGAELPSVTFQYPKHLELGDLALTAPFDLAKTLRRKPREIAETLAARLGSLPEGRKAAVAGGGYVNLFPGAAPFARSLDASLREPGPPPSHIDRVIVEHTSINPNKAAHIGHLRNAVLGDTLVGPLPSRGYPVGVQNYIDDTGVQVADVVVGFLHLEKKSLAEIQAMEGRFDYHCWDL